MIDETESTELVGELLHMGESDIDAWTRFAAAFASSGTSQSTAMTPENAAKMADKLMLERGKRELMFADKGERIAGFAK